VINTWSQQHPTAAPLVVMCDLKDDLTDNPSFAAGNLTALNQELLSVFGPRLLADKAYPASPLVAPRAKGESTVELSRGPHAVTLEDWAR
jgi:hypothetical protein